MGMFINTNVAALNAQRNLSVTGGKMSKALEQLSSGLRINRAADDAAGLAISEKMRAQIPRYADGSAKRPRRCFDDSDGRRCVERDARDPAAHARADGSGWFDDSVVGRP